MRTFKLFISAWVQGGVLEIEIRISEVSEAGIFAIGKGSKEYQDTEGEESSFMILYFSSVSGKEKCRSYGCRGSACEGREERERCYESSSMFIPRLWSGRRLPVECVS